MSGQTTDKKDEVALAVGRALMSRASGGWLRLSGCVERGEMDASAALRGIILFLESSFKSPKQMAEAESKLHQTVLGAIERAELKRLRELNPELELRLTEATKNLERAMQRVRELQELLEAARTEEIARSGVVSAAKSARVGRVCKSTPPVAKTDDPVEDWRAEIANLFLAKGFEVRVPRPNITAAEFLSGREEGGGRELIFRPPEAVLSTRKLLVALGLEDHFVLRQEEQRCIGFSPADEGYWFWAEAAEIPPRRGGSYNEFLGAAPPGWAVLALEEYILTWLVMENSCGVFPEDAPVCLRTTYRKCRLAEGQGKRARVVETNEVLQIRNHIDGEGRAELIVRSIPPDAVLPDQGARYRQLVPSSRLPD